MKKLLFLVITLITLETINAQISVKYGIEVGATSSKINSIDNSPAAMEQKSTFTGGGGFYVGALAHFNPTKVFSIQTGLRFVNISAKEKIEFLTIPGVNLNGTVKMNFVEVPVNFVFQSSKLKCKWFGHFGPQLGVALSGNTVAKITAQPEKKETLEFGNDEDQYKRVQIGMNAGLGYKVSKHVNLNTSISFGMHDIDNNDLYQTRFTTFRLGLQYTF